MNLRLTRTGVIALLAPVAAVAPALTTSALPLLTQAAVTGRHAAPAQDPVGTATPMTAHVLHRPTGPTRTSPVTPWPAPAAGRVTVTSGTVKAGALPIWLTRRAASPAAASTIQARLYPSSVGAQTGTGHESLVVALTAASRNGLADLQVSL